MYNTYRTMDSLAHVNCKVCICMVVCVSHDVANGLPGSRGSTRSRGSTGSREHWQQREQRDTVKTVSASTHCEKHMYTLTCTRIHMQEVEHIIATTSKL